LAVGEHESGRRLPLIERVRARQERHRRRNRVYRIAFAAVGFAVLLAGLIMLVTPGPGIPVIILGLGMLALEFAWAERWLERVANTVEQAVEQVAEGSPVRRAVVLGIGLLGLAALVAVILVWDIPYFPG
jgi:uncharacterized protein (TIGR02611 family)